MTMSTDTTYEALRQRHLARAGELLPPLLDRLTWPVHPNVFRSPLSRRREVVEYQVRQTPTGATVTVRVTDPQPFDPAAHAADITTELAGVGLARPEVTVEVVDALPRPPSGKLVRFVPLGR